MQLDRPVNAVAASTGAAQGRVRVPGLHSVQMVPGQADAQIDGLGKAPSRLQCNCLGAPHTMDMRHETLCV